MKTASFVVRTVLLGVLLSAFAIVGCGGSKTGHVGIAGGGSSTPTAGGSTPTDSEATTPAQPDIVYPAQWQGGAMRVPVHGKTLSEVMFNLDKETAGDKLNFVIFNVGQYSTEGFPPGATLKDVMDAGFNRWRVFFYNDPDALVIATSIDYGHVQPFWNRVNDVFTQLGQSEKPWQRLCGTLKLANGSPAKLMDYIRQLDPKGKYKVEGTPTNLRLDLYLRQMPLERALTYLAWASGASLGFDSTGTLFFTFPK